MRSRFSVKPPFGPLSPDVRTVSLMTHYCHAHATCVSRMPVGVGQDYECPGEMSADLVSSYDGRWPRVKLREGFAEKKQNMGVLTTHKFPKIGTLDAD